MQEIGKFETLKYFKEDTSNFVLPKEYDAYLFSSDIQISRKYQALFFGNVTRCLREYCIQLKEDLYISHQYHFLFSILGFWFDFEAKIFDFADRVSLIFEEKSLKLPNQPYGQIRNSVYSQVVRFGFRNWKEIVLGEKFINAELLTVIKRIESNEFSISHLNPENLKLFINLFSQIGTTNLKKDLMILKVLTAFFKVIARRFISHNLTLIKEILILIDSLLFYRQYFPNNVIILKNNILQLLEQLLKEINSYSNHFNETLLFDCPEYIDLMKMSFRCDPEFYIFNYIPQHIKYISNYIRSQRINIQVLRTEKVLEYFDSTIGRLFNRCTYIISDSNEAKRAFSIQFCKQLLPTHILSDFDKLFSQKLSIIDILWRMISPISSFVLIFSNSFTTYFSQQLSEEVRFNNSEGVHQLVSIINHIVDVVCNSDPTMVLARSSLFIPFQSDSQLIGRARGLFEQAHIPIEMQYSIAELFGIVPHIKDRSQFFKGVKHFLQNHILSLLKPDIYLEQKIIERISQYTEQEYILPIQNMIKDYNNCLSFFDSIKNRLPKVPSEISIILLSNHFWKNIVSRGNLPAFGLFNSIKQVFEKLHLEKHPHEKIIWCDPSSIVEVKLKLADQNSEQLYLFNGVQFSLISALKLGPQTIAYLRKIILVEDLEEQINTLSKFGLILIDNFTCTLATNIHPSTYRNFAHQYTSAENLAIRQLRDLDMKKSINCAICSLLKPLKEGLSATSILHEVTNKIGHLYNISYDLIIQQLNELEITKFIKRESIESKLFIYVL